MPYIVTIRKPTEPFLAGDRTAQRRAREAATSSHAVATLEEVHKHIYLLPGASGLWRQWNALPESGGTIGPSRSGTVIEVKPATYNAARGAKGMKADGRPD